MEPRYFPPMNTVEFRLAQHRRQQDDRLIEPLDPRQDIPHDLLDLAVRDQLLRFPWNTSGPKIPGLPLPSRIG